MVIAKGRRPMLVNARRYAFSVGALEHDETPV